MFKDGAIEEVKRFNKIKVTKENSSIKVIGIKEISNLVNNISTIEETKKLISIKTRQYAKRQKTWSKAHMIGWNMLYSDDFSVLTKKVLKVIS